MTIPWNHRFLESEDICRMDRWTSSPELCHIKHIWDIMGRTTGTRSYPPGNIMCLATKLVNESDQWSHKLPFFQFEIMLWGLHICKAERYSLLFHFLFHSVIYAPCLPIPISVIHYHACISCCWMVIYLYYINLCSAKY